MATLNSILPDADVLLDLEPEELAGFVLEHLNVSGQASLRVSNVIGLPDTTQGYPAQKHDQIRLAVAEAWSWLEREGLIVAKPGSPEWQTISRRGKKLATHGDVERFRKANILPRGLLHPRIATKVWAEFLRGDYDTAVFQSFKEVEVAVRAAGSFPATLLGYDLMRKAFDKETGPLRDSLNPVPGERHGRSDLFAGAIACYKNPSSHRQVNMEPEEAVEIIVLASHLLRILDSVAAPTGSGPPKT